MWSHPLRGFLLKFFTRQNHTFLLGAKKGTWVETKSHTWDFCQPRKDHPPGWWFSHVSDHTPPQQQQHNVNTTPQTMAGSHPNHRIMTNQTIHIVAYVLCCLRWSKGLQFPLNTLPASAQKWWKTVSERPLWAKRNRMGTSLAAPRFRIKPGGRRSFEGHNNPLNGEGEHNKTADCNHSGLNSVEMMTDNGPICNNQPLEG
jgi:hypothetical protein